MNGTGVADNANVNVTAGPPASIAVNAGDGQSAQVGTNVSVKPSVIVKDAGGNTISGVQVTFAVASGGGSVSGATPNTNGSGIATVGSWTLGSTAGTNNNTLTATVSGSGVSGNPVTFTASATAGPPTQIVIVTQPSSSAQAGVAFGTQPVVQLKDAGGNDSPTAGRTITATVASGPGSSLSNATATTDGNGQATFSGLSIDDVAGSYTLTFDSGSLTAATSNTITVTAGPASKLTFTGQPTSTSVNTAISPPVVVSVTDAFGNISSASVSVHMDLNQTPFSTATLERHRGRLHLRRLGHVLRPQRGPVERHILLHADRLTPPVFLRIPVTASWSVHNCNNWHALAPPLILLAHL